MKDARIDNSLIKEGYCLLRQRRVIRYIMHCSHFVAVPHCSWNVKGPASLTPFVLFFVCTIWIVSPAGEATYTCPYSIIIFYPWYLHFLASSNMVITFYMRWPGSAPRHAISVSRSSSWRRQNRDEADCHSRPAEREGSLFLLLIR